MVSAICFILATPMSNPAIGLISQIAQVVLYLAGTACAIASFLSQGDRVEEEVS